MKSLLQLKKNMLLLMALLAVFMVPMDISARELVTIVYTNSLNGYLDYCQCREEPKGGLVKRATALRGLRTKYPGMVLVDTGDFLTFEEDALLAEYVVRAYGYMKYDAIAPGDQEFSGGIDLYLDVQKRLPLVCDNLMIKGNAKAGRAAVRYNIVKRNGLSIGIIGTMSPEAFRYYPQTLTKKISLTDQAAEIQKDIDYLKKQGVAIVILLSHSGYDRDVELAGMLPDIDVIVGGHSQTLLKKPRIKGRTVIVQAGANGAHIGILEISVDKGKVAVISNNFQLPDDRHPEDDPVIRKLIKEYEAEVQKKYRKLRLK
ncbi:MAG: hypothetical protein CVV44_21575 [Spirochaetae bacterium HGW-Spirochaetae-1]|jgi:2',3'-cyclic-nucleotide 2'-phosphodiesterase (5'-nucleotidase family)|nr:MAG: hypothetical protein CVV44_21575 [Spirochaetae bacterium HGW-Spirochaetae-1]